MRIPAIILGILISIVCYSIGPGDPCPLEPVCEFRQAFLCYDCPASISCKPHYLCKKAFSRTIGNKLFPDEAILEFSVKDSLLYIFLITHDSLWVKKLKRTPCLIGSVHHFIHSIKQIDRDEFLDNGNILFRQLIYPFLDPLAGKHKLIIIPDGKLIEIPFEALVMDLPKCRKKESSFDPDIFLVNRFEILYSSSLYNWYKMVSLQKPLPEKSFIGIAPVSFRTNENNQYVQLPYSETEILEISDLFRNTNLPATSCLYNQTAKYTLKQNISGKSCIHFATHSLFNNPDPSGSGLVLSDFNDSGTDDSDMILNYNDIIQLPLTANLVVLNGCYTGKNHPDDFQSRKSLSTAFIKAGARNVIYSLWNVTDKYGYTFMKDFYKKILEGEKYAAALRETKLDFISKKETSLPYLWAGFILEGE
ncbi:MAG: CHAT domain-containing protein [Bacteroidota bacterium]|nr:CHAT domain-containing protein [Bacteroidota bacterium]